MTMEKHDVIIVGSGPAGSTLAHFLGSFNIESVVIEKGKPFRDKVCAGGLPLGIFDVLPPSVDKTFEYSSYKTFRVFYKGTLASETHFLKPFAYGVMRSNFDEHLRKGINIKYEEKFLSYEEEKDKVIVKTNKNIYEGKLLVGADGFGSLVSLYSGLNKKTKIVIAEEKEIPKKNHEESLNVYLGNFSLGYGWKFDKQTATSVGAGSLKKYFKKGVSNFVDNTSAKTKVYPISLWDRDLKLFKGRVVLAGEAASIVDPFNAAGIYHAILSSFLLSESIKENFDMGKLSFENYIEKLDDKIFNEFRYASILSSAFYPMLPLLKGIVFNKHILEFIATAQDETGYLSYRRVFERFKNSKRPEIKLALGILRLLKIV